MKAVERYDVWRDQALTLTDAVMELDPEERFAFCVEMFTYHSHVHEGYVVSTPWNMLEMMIAPTQEKILEVVAPWMRSALNPITPHVFRVKSLQARAAMVERYNIRAQLSEYLPPQLL